MAKPNEVLDRMTSAKLSPAFTIPLDQIKQMPEEYRHRADADLDQDKGSMQALMKSLITEGQRDPAHRVQGRREGRDEFVHLGGRAQAFPGAQAPGGSERR